MEVDGSRRPRRQQSRTRGRLSDRVEDAVAWLLMSLVLVAVPLAVIAGGAAYDRAMVRVRVEAAERIPARAVLLAPAGDAGAAGAASAALTTAVPAAAAPPTAAARAPARWTAPDGTPRTGVLTVRDPRPAGAEVAIWLNRSGDPVPAPDREVSAVAVGWTWGTITLVCGWAALALLWSGARRAVSARNAAGWAREWARVEPAWSGRSE